MRNIIRTSHEQRRRSSAAMQGEHPGLAELQRQSSGSGSLEALLQQFPEKKGILDNRLVGLSGCAAERRRFSLAGQSGTGSGFSSLNNSPQLLARRCSQSDNNSNIINRLSGSNSPPVHSSISQPFRRGSHPRRQRSQGGGDTEESGGIQQTRVLGTVLGICIACALVVLLSYLIKQYLKGNTVWR